jgi:hypothetical protein
MIVAMGAAGCSGTAESADAGRDAVVVDAPGDSVDAPVPVDEGTAAPAYPPLACNPDAAGEMVFGYQRGGAHFAVNPGEQANGSDFLFIDGACRYWSGGTTRVWTGTLEGEQLAAINAELLTGDWASIDAEYVMGCCDGESIGLVRGSVRAGRYDTATASPTFESLYESAAGWADRLRGTGSRVPPESPLRLEIVRVAPTGTAMPWPLDEPLSGLVGPAERSATVHIFEGADAATLRALEPGVLTDGTVYARTVAVDIVPFAGEDGCLRAAISGICRLGA